ncbi:hypothetical protein B0H14DRAFT_365271 [Mycena olivaceomarginata]|nr:hypothetical protein B0H14DRAFT_365271 [Mycena olivaceomarginata]
MGARRECRDYELGADLGALMRTGAPSSSTPSTNGEYLLAPVRSETVFAYPGTPAPGQGGFGGESFFSLCFPIMLVDSPLAFFIFCRYRTLATPLFALPATVSFLVSFGRSEERERSRKGGVCRKVAMCLGLGGEAEDGCFCPDLCVREGAGSERCPLYD